MFDYFGLVFWLFRLEFSIWVFILFLILLEVFFFSVLVLFLVSSLDGNAGSYLLVYRYGVITGYVTLV